MHSFRLPDDTDQDFLQRAERTAIIGRILVDACFHNTKVQELLADGTLSERGQDEQPPQVAPSMVEKPKTANRHGGIDDLFGLWDSLQPILDEAMKPRESTSDVASTPRQHTSNVFLCHSSKDKRFARRIANAIKAAGHTVWFDEWELLPGDSFFEKIQHGIRTYRWFAIVMSPDAVESNWCKRELHNALAMETEENTTKVIPILHRDCVFPGFLKEKLFTDCRRNCYSKGLAGLLKRLATPFQDDFKQPGSS